MEKDSEKIGRRYIERSRWGQWRVLVGSSSSLQGFRGHPGPSLLSLPLTCKSPSLLPGEFSYVYTPRDWISVTCNQDSCLINTPSLPALSSLVNYLFTLFVHFSTGCLLFLIDFYESILYVEAIFPAHHWLLTFVMASFPRDLFYWHCQIHQSFFVWLHPQTVRNSHLHFLLECL